jgi:hypothetical protein
LAVADENTRLERPYGDRRVGLLIGSGGLDLLDERQQDTSIAADRGKWNLPRPDIRSHLGDAHIDQHLQLSRVQRINRGLDESEAARPAGRAVLHPDDAGYGKNAGTIPRSSLTTID